MKKKILIYIFLGFVGVVIAGLIYYSTLDDRHQAYYKTRFLHALHLLDPNWEQTSEGNTARFISPTLLIDRKFKSMEGPAAIDYFTINDKKEELVWLTSFKTKALDLEGNPASADFICHTNLDFVYIEHYGRWGLNNEMHRGYPRLSTVSNGIIAYDFPDGFGFPLFTNEKILLQTQVLNHNLTDTVFKVKHQYDLTYKKHEQRMKPLLPISAYIRIPFENATKKNPNDLPDAFCIPVDSEIHSEMDPETQQTLSSFWIIPEGKKVYRGNINDQLRIQDSISVHMIVPHLHPFSERFQLVDKTTNTILFECDVENFKDKIGLKDTPVFKSTKGFKMYQDHDYELVIHTNNTSGMLQDMMASMFIYVHDEEMDNKIQEFTKANDL